MLESEITHLISRMPDLVSLKSVEIEQHYLSESRDPLRLRRYGQDRFELTKKITIDPNDFSRKEEINIPLGVQEYADLLKLSRRGLTKRRYYLPLDNGLKAEIDVFAGPLEGLAMVEVEFPDEQSRDSFEPPDWFGPDITQAEWATNSYLAGRTAEEIGPLVEAAGG